MKKIKKIMMATCLVLALTLVLLGISLSVTSASASALANNLPKVTTTDSLSKRAALVLQDEYDGGVHSECNQWIQYGYDLTTFSEYDYIIISLVSSSTVVLFDDATNTYQYSTSNRHIEMVFKAAENSLDFDDTNFENTNDGEVTIIIEVYIDNDVVQFNEYHISIHITPYGSFTTPYDIKSAKWTYNEWLFEADIIDNEEHKARNDNLFRATIEGDGVSLSPMSSSTIPSVKQTDVVINYAASVSSNSVCLSGTVTWTDKNGDSHPARQVRVEIWHSGILLDTKRANLETNSNGDFYASGLSTSDNLYIKVYSTTQAGFGVKNFWGSRYYFSTTPKSFTRSTTGFARERGTNAADAFYIHQAVIVGKDYASAMGYSNTPTVTFPRSATQYNPVTDTLWIITNDYCDFDVILHEYGHYIMDKLNIEDQPSGKHSSSDILTDKLQHKEKGVKFAWGEGWPTYFSISAQLHQNVAALSIPNAGDTFYHDTIDGNFSYDIKGNADRASKGEGNERAVSRVLLNLTYTGTSTSPIMSYQTLWNLCNNSKAKHLSDFMAQVYANTTKSQISAIGTILQNQNITPTLPVLPSDILNYNTSTFKWTVNTDHISTTYHDSFTVVFMDLNYNINHEVSVSTNKSVDLTNHIDTLISVLPSEFYWGIRVNQYESSANTGPYYSVLQRMTGIGKYTYFSSSDSYEFTKITNVSGNYNMSSTYNGKSVTAIGTSAFADQATIPQITIPASVTKINKDAFDSTNNIPIYLNGRTSVPTTYDINWNSSENPVYFNGILCTHIYKSTIKLNATQHGDLCNHCKTVINKMNHRMYTSGEWEYCYECSYSRHIYHTHSYTYTFVNGTAHLKVCNCGYSENENHNLIYYFSPTQHWKKCTKCHYQTSSVNHSWHTEPTGRTYCTVCSYESLVQPWSINEPIFFARSKENEFM